MAKSKLRIVALAAGFGAAAVFAGPVLAAKQPVTTSLTGMWTVDQAYFDKPKSPLPLTPAGQAIREARTKAVASGDVIGNKSCAPHGMPSMMANEFALEFLETPGRVTIINEAATMPRSIYLNKAQHADEIEPSWNGHSVGHWEGKTLVVDTVNFNDKGDVLGFIGVKSSTTHLVERYHVENGGKTLIGDFTFEDPRYLTKPVTVRATYHRLPADSELWEYACEIGGGWQERFKDDKSAGPGPTASN